MSNIKKILIAVDGGPTSEKVASNGLQLAQQLHAELAVISVLDTTALMSDGAVTPDELAAILKNDLKNSQQLLVDNIFKDQKVWTFVENGKPVDAILKVADEWEADLIVLGTHGRAGLSHLIMGSVAEKVIRHSTKPILIIPTRP
ncbi:universal stress protein [Flavihumibacter fluvii]|uniref:universal stress protein n=1 Tax=Flavihumibacter fluvii TaxID=2838157 RepID=UPI001BDF3C43|nr:universal stress protein [Flavihumibacter fluvii]ULQ51923.1 universal stress protein [Flavihumibacter fluvii]